MHQQDASYYSYLLPPQDQMQLMGAQQMIPQYQVGVIPSQQYYYEYPQQQQTPEMYLQQTQPGFKIHVGNLPLSITQDELGQVFSKFGNVTDVKIIKKTSQGMPLHMFCYAFVQFDSQEACDQALMAGVVNDWSVKSLIDKTKHQQQQPKRNRSRSRSRSRERSNKRGNRESEPTIFILAYTKHTLPPKENSPLLSPQPIQDLSKRVLVPNDQETEEIESPRPVQVQVTVRELFVTGIPRDRDENFVRQLFSKFGAIEKVDMYPKTNIFYTYVKFFMVESAWNAFESSSLIQGQFTMPQFIKIYYSDPIKRSYIVGNNAQYEKITDLTNVVFVYFPPHPSLKLDMRMILQICEKCGSSVQAWQYNQQDPQYKSYLLLEFEDINKSQYMRDYLARNITQLFGDDKTEVGILPDDSRFQQNPQHKVPTMGPQYTTRQSQFRQQQQMKLYQQQQARIQQSTQPQYQSIQQPVIPIQPPTTGFGVLDDLCPIRNWQQQQPQVQQQQTPQNDKFMQDIYNLMSSQPVQQQAPYQQQQSYIQYAPQQPYEEDEPDTFWSGFMTRSKSHKVGVDARIIDQSENTNVQLPNYLNVAYRANIEDAVRKMKQGVKLILTPANQTQDKEFEDYIKYFKEKSKVGVVQLDNQATLYIIPACPEIENIKLGPLEMFAIYYDPKQEQNKKLTPTSNKIQQNILNYNPDL